MGVPPLWLELLTCISGVSFDQCFARGVTGEVDGIRVPNIHLDLKKNKRASGRPKDIADLEELE